MLFLMLAQGNFNFAEWMTSPPGSMIFILLLSTLVAIISTILTKWLVDTAEIARKQKQIKAHQEEKAEIIKLADIDPDRYRKKVKRWQKREMMLKQTQQKMALQRLKPQCVTCIPMIVIFYILNATIFGTNPVAAPPMNAYDVPMLGGMIQGVTESAPEWTTLVYGMPKQIEARHGWINFTAWYFICSLGINTLLQRLLKLQTQASGGMEQMLKGTKSQAQEFPDV